MEAKHTPMVRIDSIAFRRGERAYASGASNPYNGPELRDEWQAGWDYAARNSQGYKDGISGKPMEMCLRGSKYAKDYRIGAATRARACLPQATQ